MRLKLFYEKTIMLSHAFDNIMIMFFVFHPVHRHHDAYLAHYQMFMLWGDGVASNNWNKRF